MQLTTIAESLRLAASVSGLIVLAVAFIAAFRAQSRPAGREEAGARLWLAMPTLAVQTALFVLGSWLAWRPLPLSLTGEAKSLLTLFGLPFYFGGFALYLSGMTSLGRFFGASSSRAVRLQAGHRLVTTGPFRFVRHPMYLGLILAAIGALLIYFTWTTLAFALFAPGLAVRARREEKLLAAEFGNQWTQYAACTPAWLPRRIKL